MADTSQPLAEMRTPDGSNPVLVSALANIVLVMAVCVSLYQLYTAGITALTALVQRSIHLGAILSLAFLLKPPFPATRKDRWTLWLVIDLMLVAASVICTVYIIYNLSAIFERQGDWRNSDVIISIIGTLLVLEACRRVIGFVMTAICILAILYAILGPYMPELIIHKGYSYRNTITFKKMPLLSNRPPSLSFHLRPNFSHHLDSCYSVMLLYQYYKPCLSYEKMGRHHCLALK